MCSNHIIPNRITNFMFYLEYFHFVCLCIFLSCSFFLILSKDPVYSVLLLILNFFISFLIAILFGEDFSFLGGLLLFIRVYVGFGAVLFLFVVMMLELKIELIVLSEFFRFLVLIFCLFFLCFYLILKFDFISIFQKRFIVINFFDSILDSFANIDIFGQSLFNYFLPCVLLAGLGAIFLMLKYKSNRKIQIVYKQLFSNLGEISFLDLFFSLKIFFISIIKYTLFVFLFILVYGITRNSSYITIKSINSFILCDSDSTQLVTTAAGAVTTLGYVMGGGLVLGAGLCGLGIVSGILLLIRNRAIFFDSLHPKGIVQTGLAKEKADPSLVPPVSIKREDWEPTATVPEHFETAEEAAQNPDSGPGDFYEKFCRFLSYNFPEGDKAWAFFLKHLNYSSGWYSHFDDFIPWLDEQFIKFGTSGFYSVYVYWLWGGSIGLPITFGLFVQIALKCLWHFKVWGFFYSSIFISYHPLLVFSYTNCKFVDL